jgi:hypothetical protein
VLAPNGRIRQSQGDGDGSDETQVGRSCPGDETRVVGNSLPSANRPGDILNALRRRFHLPSVARCCCAIGIAAKCRAAATRPSSTCIIFVRGKPEAGMTKTTLLTLCGAHHRACTVVIYLSREPRGRLAFRHARRDRVWRAAKHGPKSTWYRRRFEAHETWALVNEKRACRAPSAPMWVTTVSKS